MKIVRYISSLGQKTLHKNADPVATAEDCEDADNKDVATLSQFSLALSCNFYVKLN